MIRNFKNKAAQDIYDGESSRYARTIPIELHEKVRRLFDQLNAVIKVDSLKIPPSNRLEKLSGKLKDFYSLRVNKQWRIIFKWAEGDALDVDVVDYHSG